MRLLKLDGDGCVSLRWFPKDKVPPYAILSHTWGGEDDEVTFTDLVNGTAENKGGFQKLRFCGSQAKDDDLQYFWPSTLFRWYQYAARCYVYLSDVSVRSQDGQFVHVEWESAFRNSRWFTRGWTLQELLAPKVVDFYSRDRIRLGDKHSLGQQIVGITGIAIEALRGRPLSLFSIEERSSWTEKRQTTMEEDQAYCLLGIFGVFLPLIYGEGLSNATRRLRKEIRESLDTESQPIGNICQKLYLSLANSSLDEASFGQSTSMDAELILEPSRRGSGMPMPGATTEDVYVAVMGVTGSGKSSLINVIAGTGMIAVHNLPSWTRNITSYSFMYKESLRIHVIEIPDFDDAYRSAAEVLNEFASWLSDIYNKNSQLSGIIYLHRISDARLKESGRKNLEMLQKLCGPDYFPNIILATTFWDNIEPSVGAAREKELVEREYLWGPMLSCGSVAARHSGSRQSAMAILEQSLRSRRLWTLQIQREISRAKEEYERQLKDFREAWNAPEMGK